MKKLLPGIIAAAALALTLGCSTEQGPQPIKAGDYDGPPPGAGKAKDAEAAGQGS